MNLLPWVESSLTCSIILFILIIFSIFSASRALSIGLEDGLAFVKDVLDITMGVINMISRTKHRCLDIISPVSIIDLGKKIFRIV